jgi:hypothetical protein
MVHLAASVGCVLYRFVSWNLFRVCERDKRKISHKLQKPIQNNVLIRKK